MEEKTTRALDATDSTEILIALQAWINGLNILGETLYREYPNGAVGYYIRCDEGTVTEEDICGNFSAEVKFGIYFTTSTAPDSAGAIFEPLNDLSAWFRENGTAGLTIGSRRTPDEITTLKAPTETSEKDEAGNITFISVYTLTYYEEAI